MGWLDGLRRIETDWKSLEQKCKVCASSVLHSLQMIVIPQLAVNYAAAIRSPVFLLFAGSKILLRVQDPMAVF